MAVHGRISRDDGDIFCWCWDTLKSEDSQNVAGKNQGEENERFGWLCQPRYELKIWAAWRKWRWGCDSNLVVIIGVERAGSAAVNQLLFPNSETP